MRVLLDAEKIIYEHWLKEIVKPHKTHDCGYKSCMSGFVPPKDFENHTPCEDSKKW